MAYTVVRFPPSNHHASKCPSSSFSTKVFSPSPRGFLLQFPPGAYTALRTIHQRREVLCLQHHIKRLVNSTKLTTNPTEQYGAVLSVKSCSHLLQSTLDLLRNDFKEKYSRIDSELMVVTLLFECCCLADEEWQMFGHACVLPKPKAFVNLCVAGNMRTVAAAKHSQWIRDRKSLEKLKGEKIDEVLLSDDDGNLLEGLISNFFVVSRDGTVHTSPENILLGHMRQLVIQCCRENNIKIKLCAPNIRDIYDEAFITSTVQTVTSVKSIVFLKHKMKDFHFENSPITNTIRTALLRKLNIDAYWSKI